MHAARYVPYEARDAESHVKRIAECNQGNADDADNGAAYGKPHLS